MKVKRLKKQVIVKSGICAVLIFLCLGLAVFTTFYGGDMETRTRQLRIQVTAMQAKHASLLRRFKMADEVEKTYHQINPQDDPLFGTLDRKRATVLLDQLNQQYQLQNLNLSISPASARDATPLQFKSGATAGSQVALAFESITDEFAFAFIRDILASFPGFLHITRVTLTKNAPTRGKTDYDAAKGELPAQVKGEFIFEWVGLELKK